MKLHLPLMGLALGLSMSLSSQTNLPVIQHRTCGSQAPSPEWDEWFNKKVEEFKQNLATGKAQMINYSIPVVVHVIHGGQGVGSFPNVSQAQLNSQITILNQDFAGTGFNSGQLASTGFSVVGAANTGISFCAAQKDPSGATLTEPGIDRVNYVTKGWSNPTSFTSISSFQNFINSTVKPNTIWDPTRYLNIWVSDCSNNVGLLGYATFPAGTGLTGISGGTGGSTTDGIWCWTAAYGNVGTLAPPFNKGRTATHEIGHWIGLRHIGGDGNGNPSGDCNATDYCNDTPPQKGGFGGGQYGQNYGGPSYPLNTANSASCSAAGADGDMFMNFMDYTDDAFMYMFTPDQSARFQTAMQNGTYRSQLAASAATLCSVTTGVNSNSVLDNVVSLYPNPSNGIVNIAYTLSGTHSLELSVHNSLGQLITAQKFSGVNSNTYKIDLGAYPAGVYFVTMNNGQEKVIKRLILNK